MSLRSRLGPEISFALNSLALLSSTAPGEFTFNISPFPDLLEEFLEFFEDVVTGNDGEDEDDDYEETVALATILRKNPSKAGQQREEADTREEYCNICTEATNVEYNLRSTAQEKETSQKFAGLDRAETALACIGLLLNLASVENIHAKLPSNVKVLSEDSRVIRMSLLAIQTARQLRHMPNFPGNPLQLSKVQLLQAKKDVIQLIGQLGQAIQLENQPPWVGQAVIDLVDYFLHTSEPSSLPTELANQAKPFGPGLDASLLALSKIALTDPNRDALSKLPSYSLSIRSFINAKFTILMNLLPVNDVDFQFLTTEPSLLRMELVAMCLFNLVYMANPDGRKKLRERPGVLKTLARIVGKLYGVHLAAGSGQPNSAHSPYLVLCQRCIEVLRVLSEDESGSSGGARSTGSQEGIAWFGSFTDSRGGGEGGRASFRSRPSLLLCKTDFIE